MPIITKYIDYECRGLLKGKTLKRPEFIAKKFHILQEEIILIEKENKNGQLSTFIRIPILNVMKQTPTSTHKFIFKCDECGKEVTMTIGSFLRECNDMMRMIPKSLTDVTFCSVCKQIKTTLEIYGVENVAQSSIIQKRKEKTNLERYGVKNVAQSNIVQEKIKQTNLKRYNVEAAIQSEKVKKKIKQTNLIRYGVENVLKNKKIQEKIKQTNLDRYGVEYVLQSPEIQKKIKQTNLIRYGVENPTQNSEISKKVKITNLKKYGVTSTTQIPSVRKKQMETMYKNGTVTTSRQQRKIFELLFKENYNVALNFPFNNYFLDIAFLDMRYYLEYNGGGHDLSVKLGKISEKEFQRKEIKRRYILKKAGWKELTIISKDDKLPNDNVLLKMINLAKEYLINTNHTWIHINLDKQCFIFTRDRIIVSFDSLKTIL